MKKVVKRIFALLFTVCVLLTGANSAMAADDGALVLPDEPVEMYGGYLKQKEPICLGEDPRGCIQTFSNAAYDRDEVALALRDALVACEAEFDVSAYDLSEEEVTDLWQHVADRYGEVFHTSQFRYYYVEATGTVTRMAPVYTMTAGEYAAARQILDEKLDAIISQVEPTFTDLQKVLFIHDYLAANFEYDVEGAKTGDAVFDAYTFLTGGIGVCQAYTLTFEAIMDRLGIPVSYVSSNSLLHIWNMVQLDGVWYQLDITHDDPVIDRLGAVEHSHFLVSDAKMKEIKKDNDIPASITDWVYGVDTACTDTRYESWFWAEASSPFVYASGAWYCICSGGDKNGLCQWDGSSNGCTLVEEVESLGGWVSGSGASVSFGAGLGKHHGSLYFSAPDGVYQYDLETTSLTQLASSAGYPYDDLIYGLRIVGNTLFYENRADATGKTIKTIELSPYFDVEGICSWYADGETVYLRIPQAAQQPVVMVAWYSGKRLVKTQMYTAPGDFDTVGGDGCRCKIMALAQNSYSPLCEAVEAVEA